MNPASPNFMKWNFQQPDPARYMPCVEPVMVMGPRAIERVFGALFGSRDACQGRPRRLAVHRGRLEHLAHGDIRPPAPGEERTAFWDLPSLRDPGTTELVLAMPAGRVHEHAGLLRQLAHQPQQLLPRDHQPGAHRGPGRAASTTATRRCRWPRPASTAMHVEPGTVCYACHQVLDPMRDFFRQSYSSPISSSSTLNPPQPACRPRRPSPSTAASRCAARACGVRPAPWPGTRASRSPGPRSCASFANASPCHEDDPEFQRVAKAFAGSNHDWKMLVRELYLLAAGDLRPANPIVDEDGVVMSIARRETLCDAAGQPPGHDRRVQHQQGESGAGPQRRRPGPQPVAGHRRVRLRPGRRAAGHAPRPEPVLRPRPPRSCAWLLAGPAGRGTQPAAGRWTPRTPAFGDFVQRADGGARRTIRWRRACGRPGSSNYDAAIAAKETPGRGPALDLRAGLLVAARRSRRACRRGGMP